MFGIYYIEFNLSGTLTHTNNKKTLRRTNMKELAKVLHSANRIADAFINNVYENTDSVKLLIQIAGKEHVSSLGKEATMKALAPFMTAEKQKELLTDVNVLQSFLEALKIHEISFCCPITGKAGYEMYIKFN